MNINENIWKLLTINDLGMLWSSRILVTYFGSHLPDLACQIFAVMIPDQPPTLSLLGERSCLTLEPTNQNQYEMA
jgi:hypothetical protein